MGVGHDHNRVKIEGQSERPIWWALGLTTTFLIAKVVGGILTNSLALISDATHMFTDSAALAISLVAIRIGRRPADRQRIFGYYRSRDSADRGKPLRAGHGSPFLWPPGPSACRPFASAL